MRDENPWQNISFCRSKHLMKRGQAQVKREPAQRSQGLGPHKKSPILKSQQRQKSKLDNQPLLFTLNQGPAENLHKEQANL